MYSLIEQAKIRLRLFDSSSGSIVFKNTDEDFILAQLEQEAWQDIKTKRDYPSEWNDEKIANDLKRFENVALKLMLYDYNKEGAEFESHNNEHGNSRTYEKRESILADVFPLVKVL